MNRENTKGDGDQYVGAIDYYGGRIMFWFLLRRGRKTKGEGENVCVWVLKTKGDQCVCDDD